MNNKIEFAGALPPLLAMRGGPLWKDCCNHEPGAYVASFEVFGKENPGKYDLYLYHSQLEGQCVCIRYGNKDKEYISPGMLGEFIRRRRDCTYEPYTTAIRILLAFGNVTWEKKQP